MAKAKKGRVAHRKTGRGQFLTISLPTSLIEEVERVVERLGYWSAKTDFVRQAVLRKSEKYKLEERNAEEKGEPIKF